MAIYNVAREKVLSAFHRSNAFVRGLRGPLGSGKSVACCNEIVRRGREQVPFEGVRRTRWGAIRNSYPELRSTTIRTWQDWFPEEDAPVTWGAPISSMFKRDLPDGTRMECEVLFVSCDRPDDVKKLKSLDLTGLWINEASELPKAILDMATSRVGRYPPKAMGGCTWSGVFMDTNSMDDDHWWYELAENPSPEELAQRADLTEQLVAMGAMQPGQLLYEFFAQPGALLKVDGKYVPNPEAENVSNHSLGYGYWLRQIAGKADHWIKVYVLGQYGTVHDGKPVYPEYNDNLHCKEISPIQGVPLVIGRDFGLTPAAVITQVDSRGRFLVLDEVCGTDMDERAFLEDLLIPFLMREYPQHWAKKDKLILQVADPAGAQRAQSDSRSCFDESKAKGLKIRPAKSNDWLPRRGAVAWYLSKLSGGQPMFLIDPYCTVSRKGFNGAYKYRRIQVTGEERYTEEPVKNAASHPHDAIQYAAMESGGIQAIRAKDREEGPRTRMRKPFDPSMGHLG
jgi:hypothetical protein